MGAQPSAALTETADRSTVRGDQAIFTSVFSHTGEGYRLVAASAGLLADERREITQRSPSHGSLCEESPDSVAVSAYPLGSGRFCVAHSCPAGTEHTARGGPRVYTHAVVLTDADYSRVQHNPLRVHASLTAAIGAPLLKPPPRLDPICLTVEPGACWGTVTAPPSDGEANAEQISALLSQLLADRRVVVVGASCPVKMLEWTLMALPLCERKMVAGSVGLKFSPGRQMRLTFIDRNQREAQRAIFGHAIHWFDMAAAPWVQRSPFDPWLALIRRWWNRGRFGEIIRLTSRIVRDASPRRLGRIAAICEDMDRVEVADEETLAGLLRTYAALVAVDEPEIGLLTRLREAVDRRAQGLLGGP